MTAPHADGSTTPSSTGWPKILGILGMVLGTLMVLDELDDLLMPLFWTEDHWRRWVGPAMAQFIGEAMPPTAWLVLSGLITMALGAMLFVGSLRLKRRRRTGVALCRTWAGLAIAWALIEIGRAGWWIQRFGGDIPGVPRGTWEGYAGFGLAVGLVVLLAYPVFLLVWLGRPAVRAEYAGWG